MKKTLAAMALVLASPAYADGELNIYNWGNYTSPEMIEKFEAETGIKVTITDFDSNDTALAKVGATPVWLMDDAPLLHAIRIIKANGATVEARHILRAASEDLLARGAETQLVGCSEFSLIADATSAEARMIDTLDVLVDAVVAFATSKD